MNIRQKIQHLTRLKSDIIVAVDPDVDKSGVAVLDTKTRKLTYINVLDLPSLILYVQRLRNTCNEEKKTLCVIVEASWGSSHNHHMRDQKSMATASKTGYNIGRNHQIGIDICAVISAIGVTVVEKPPLRKRWKGRDGKITHEELVAITKTKLARTNQEMRDAALLAWLY